MARKIWLWIISLFIIISIVPYLIPVTRPSGIQEYPFANSAYASIDSVSVHYRVWQRKETVPLKGKVLLIHGLGGSTFSWRNNIDALLDAGNLVVAVDLPGFGFSGRNRGLDHSQENRSRKVWSLLQRLDAEFASQDSNDTKVLNQGWYLVGHSMGAGTVTSMALANPEETKGVVYVSPAVLSGGNRGGMLTKYPPLLRWIEVLGRHVLLNEARVSTFLASAYGRPANPEEVQGYLQPLQLPGTEGVFLDLVKTSTPTTADELEQLTLPVGAIWGELDSWVPLDDAYRLKEIVPHLDLRVIPDSHHCPMETEADVFNNHLLQLIS